MGDIHVHTAPHGYEAQGYAVWYWGDMAFSCVYCVVAAGEVSIAVYMRKRHDALEAAESGGGHAWWRFKFVALCSLVPLTLLRAWNLWLWGEFNGEAGRGFGDPKKIDRMKVTGDWLNGVTFWYLMAIKALFLLTWVNINRHAGHIRWNSLYLQVGGVMSSLVLALGVPQTLVVEYGRICQEEHQNDYCRKYHDTMSTLAALQALIGLAFGVAFGVNAWRFTDGSMQGYQSIPTQSLVSGGHRDSYGSTANASDSDDGYSSSSGHKPHQASSTARSPAANSVSSMWAASDWGMGGERHESEAIWRVEDARRYNGVAACIFWSLIAHTAFNVCFAWYAVGGLGLMGNGSLMTLTMLKLIAVEVAPISWLALTIYADAADAERATGREGTTLQPVSSSSEGERGGLHAQSEKSAGKASAAHTQVHAVGSAATMMTAHQVAAEMAATPPPPATAYQIE